MKKRILALFLCALLVTGVLGGCSSATKPNNADSNTGNSSLAENNNSAGHANEITVGIAQDLGDSLDPYQMAAAGTREVMFNVYEGLVKTDSDGNLNEAVASEYSISDDGLTYTFTLREGVKFHNGQTVTAEDVLYSFDTCAATDVDTSLVAALSNVADKTVSDDGKIVVTLSERDNNFITYVSSVYIVPRDYADQSTAPVGTGPFKFVSRSVQQNIILDKNEDYYGTPAKLDRVTYKIYANATALVTALDSGSIDLVSHLTSDQAAGLSGEYEVLEGTMNLVQALYLNNAVAPFDNELVRQALCYAIDVDGLLALTSDGHGTKVGSSMYPNFGKYFDASLADKYGYDPDKAKELLTQAGYANGFSFKITVPSNYTPHVQTAEAICEQLATVGVTASLDLVEWDTWLERVYSNRQFETTVIGFDASSMTADAMLARWMSGSSKNMINYSNPDYDSVMAKAQASTDDGEQTALYKQALEILADTAANVYIQDMADFVAIKTNLKGYEFYPIYVMDMSTLYWAD
ncbi:MAG: ABC transporter substrate-binding protein [Oscillospiraceae bacterium]|nr:ABC transporter substrate-binding protein [Oscillospiraceae bacterium]